MEQTTQGSGKSQAPEIFDVIVVGTGMMGIYALYCLRERGLTTRAFEAGDGVGGTWYWNRYPGARCDMESVQYCYNFSEAVREEWNWTQRYASQPEILSYLNHVADRFDLRRDIKFETRVTSAVFDDKTSLWTLETDRGDVARAGYCIMATGSLSTPFRPDFPGIEDFRGEWYHGGTWPHEKVDLAGKRVGVIGTGSTGIQLTTAIAPLVEHLTVFQRTANYSTPARNRPLDPEELRAFRANHAEWFREATYSHTGITSNPPSTNRSAHEDTPEERQLLFEDRWAVGGQPQIILAIYNDINFDKAANDTVADFVRQKIREIVDDPDVAELLCPPKDLPIGSKRPPIDAGYFEMFNRDNVTLVDVRSAPIERITPTGLRTTDADYEFDAIIFATGFDALTGAMLAIDVRGRGGVMLKDIWAEGPQTNLGIMVAGLPNMFMIHGPGSTSVKVNMFIGGEHQIDWIMDCINHLDANGFDCIETTESAQADWDAHVQEVAEASLQPVADSWYVGANIPGKPRVYMPYFGGFERYWKHCDEITADGYRGFTLSQSGSARQVPTVAAE